MNDKKTVFHGMMTATASSYHPLQSTLTFVFTDFLPNANRQGVPVEEAQNVIDTGLHMPVKLKLSGENAAGHYKAKPIGPITAMRLEGDRIIGEAIVWRDEFPTEVEFLETASAEEGGVQFSWELYHHGDYVDQSGVQWLTGIVTAGIAIVDVPAYRGRTPLLSIAEEMTMEDELEQRVAVAAEEHVVVEEVVPTQPIAVVEVPPGPTALESAMAELDACRAERDALASEVVELRAFRAGVEAASARMRLTAVRSAALIDAGIILTDDEFREQADFLLSLSDDAFSAYIKSIASVVSKLSKASASTQSIFPDPLNIGGVPTSREVAKSLRNLKKMES